LGSLQRSHRALLQPAPQQLVLRGPLRGREGKGNGRKGKGGEGQGEGKGRGGWL